MSDKINIMIIDDSSVVRKILDNILSSVDGFEVVAKAIDGLDAIEKLCDKGLAENIDVVLLDIEMPRLNGIEALPRLKQYTPRAKIIMASTLTKRNASVSLEALDLGATDYITKPSSAINKEEIDEFSRNLVEKIKAHGKITSRIRQRISEGRNREQTQKKHEDYKLVSRANTKPKAIAIGSSTGGPDALLKVLGTIDPEKIQHLPIFITQHMPPHFTTILASNLKKNTGLDCMEAQDNQIVENGKVYIAPGDFHMEIKKDADGNYVIKLNQNPQENFCRPAVDPMLRSLSAIYKSSLLVCILTGMGSDGCKGAVICREAGSTVIAQDEETSTVYGMPAAVAKAGICSDIIPLSDVGKIIMEIC